MPINDRDKYINAKRSGGAVRAARVFFCSTVLLMLADAHAQFSGSASVVSQYRYRGIALSDGQSEAQFSVNYDASVGGFVGATASGVDLYGRRSEQVIAFGGFSGSLQPGLAWEGGLLANRFLQDSDYNYNEVFAGLSTDRVSVRAFYSPSYFYQGSSSLYTELNGNYPLRDHLYIVLHVGELRLFSDGTNHFSPSSRVDYRIGLNGTMHDWTWQLAWVGLQRKNAEYPQFEDLHPNALIASISLAF